MVRGARWHGSPCCRPAAQMLVMEPLDTDCDAPNWYFRKVLMVACDAPRLCMRQTTWRRRGLISFPGMPSAPAERGQDAREAPTRPGETWFFAAMFFPQRYRAIQDCRDSGESQLCVAAQSGAVAVYASIDGVYATAILMDLIESEFSENSAVLPRTWGTKMPLKSADSAMKKAFFKNFGGAVALRARALTADWWSWRGLFSSRCAGGESFHSTTLDRPQPRPLRRSSR